MKLYKIMWGSGFRVNMGLYGGYLGLYEDI